MFRMRQWMFATLVAVVSGVGGAAHAAPAVEEAVSVAASVGSQGSDSVRVVDGDGSAIGPTASVTGILSAGPMALGGTAELAGLNGVAITTFGGLGGVRLPIGPRLRLLAVVEGGEQVFHGSSLVLMFGTVTPSETSLPYVGGRVGVTWLAADHLDLGVMAFARGNLGSATMTYREDNFLGGDPTITTKQLGGFSAGLALQIGFRFDTGRAL